MKVALVYDRVNKWGGAERVIVALHKIFPQAALYTSVYKENRASWAKKIPVIPSFLQKIPFATEHHEALGVLMPIAFESFNFDGYDLVISLTSEAAKGVITRPPTRHISIILTPTRYLWSGYKDYFSNELFKMLALPAVAYLRFWDKIAANRPDKLIAISKTVQNRISKYYGLPSQIIYPPLMIRSGKIKPVDGKYFLVVSRLVPYKKVDLAVAAANKSGVQLKIIGTGNELSRLKKMARSNIEFLGQVTDSELKKYYTESKALIFPGIEDFGLTMVEAQSFGKPVIAYRGGGAEEIIIDGVTGKFFDKQNSSDLARVLKNFRPKSYNIFACKRNARRFSFESFKQKINDIIN